MKLPEYEINKEWMDKEPSASLCINKIKWIIITSFLLICIIFGYGLGHRIGAALGNEITIVNDKNEARKVKIIPVDKSQNF
jgi:hypothetical protein